LDSAAFAAEWPGAVLLALCEAVRASGLMPLHAAVATRGAQAVAFLAPSGTGKSTTLVRAIRAGWTPVAEDFAWLDPETLAVYGWDRGIRLWSEGLALVGGADGERWRAGADGKLFADYGSLGMHAVRYATLTRLALLTRDGERPSRREPLAPREAVRALWEATGVPLAPRVRAWTARQLPRLLAGLRVERLRLGRCGWDERFEL
jgi:hypothetical protein